ncbi:MAG: hypothetical protein RIR79_2240 [Pseudomonadota bacterium]|jgi:MFS family permease
MPTLQKIFSLSQLPVRILPFARVVWMVALFMLSATLMRWTLYAAYPADFQMLDAAQVISAFGVGWRFDISMILGMVIFPLLFLLLPFQWSHHRYWQRFWQWLIYGFLLIFIGMMAVDTVYFGYVHRHIGSEINTLANDMPSMIGIALRQYSGVLLGFGLGAVVLGGVWHAVFASLPVAPASPWQRLVMLPIVFLLMLVVARGGVDGKPISVGEAFFSNTPAQGYLALNGAFALSRALLEEPPALKDFMPPTQAHALVQTWLSGYHGNFSEAEYPLYRMMPPSTTHQDKPKPNVVVLMLESWGAQHINAETTPNFHALIQTGRLYSRFYANGQRSIQGAAAILASQPTFSGMPFLGEGLEQNRQSFMGEVARSQGYETFFLQSSEHGSLRFDAIAARAGFDTYKGAEDIPNLHEKPKPPMTWGTWDHNTFQAAHQLFAAASDAKKPFLGFIFTSSTHTPWLTPDARFEKFKENGKSDKDQFLNSLYYADWALGEFMQSAKKSGYYDNTIFILTADHADEFVENPDHIPNLYHIPLLIVGPKIKSGVDETWGSQFDILPTLIDIGGWKTHYAGLGRSLFDNSRPEARASLGIRGNELDWITLDGWVSHNLERVQGHSKGMSQERVAKITQQLLATYQTASYAQAHNRIAPPSPPVQPKSR